MKKMPTRGTRAQIAIGHLLNQRIANFLKSGSLLWWRNDPGIHTSAVRMVRTHGTPENFSEFPTVSKLNLTFLACLIHPKDPSEVEIVKNARLHGIQWYLHDHYWTPGANTAYALRLFQSLKTTDHEAYEKYLKHFRERGTLRPSERPPNFDKIIAELTPKL